MKNLLRNAVLPSLMALLGFASATCAQTQTQTPAASAKAPAKGSAQAPAKTAAAKPATLVVPQLKFEKYKLDNGLEVILSEDHRLPMVAVNLWYHVGPANELPGRTGFAHLFEHMMFEGSRHVPGSTHFHFLEAAGASDINGTTDFDRTNYFETLPSNQLELALWLESDRMGYLPDKLDSSKLRAGLVFYSNGEWFSETALASATDVDAKTRIASFRVELPLGKFPIGQYDVRAIAVSGDGEQTAFGQNHFALRLPPPGAGEASTGSGN